MDLWILILIGILLLGIIILYAIHGGYKVQYKTVEPPLPKPLIDSSGASLPFVKDTSGNIIGLEEKKRDNPACGDIMRPCHEKELVFVEDAVLKPYSKDPINGVDDYEYSLVFKNEGDRAMTKETRNLLMSSYPMDWSTQPPSSAQFQRGLTAFKEAFENAPQKGSFPNIYRTVDGTNMIPPESGEMKEREVLATYVPKKPQELTTYDVEDAKELIDKIYTAKGLKANYKQTGKNQFTVMDTRPLDEKIKYEDEYVLASSEAVKEAGEEVIIVPSIASDYRAGLDPFFTPGEKTRDRPWDYTSWTPGLERMFAPSEPRTKWF
jgi:hypothetical protein